MKIHYRLLIFVAAMFLANAVVAQFGVRAKYNRNSFSGFDNFIENTLSGQNEKIFPTTIGIGVDYWFRLKEHRVEFLPEIHIGLPSKSSFSSDQYATSFGYYGFNFNTQVYVFDLKGDCDCPTFSKQGPSLGKSLFLNISPGVIYNSKELSVSTIDPSTLSSSQVNFKIGVGVGFDIGISDMFTITPMINYTITPGLTYDELQNLETSPITVPFDSDSSMNQVQFQIRFGFRPDYVKKYGRR